MRYGARVDSNLAIGQIAPNSRQWHDNAVVTTHCCNSDEACDYADDCQQNACDCECEICLSLTPEYIDGTSAILIDDPDDLDAIRAAVAPYSAGESQIAILSSDYCTGGTDDGEIVMRRATVLAIIPVSLTGERP